MTERKQIEEMAQKIRESESLCAYRNCKDCAYYKKGKIDYVCQSLSIAAELSKHYQPKIPQGAIVLKVRDGMVLDYSHGLEEGKAQARKETAKEILQNFFDWLDFDELNDTDFIHIMRKDFERRLSDFAKQYGVEVEQ